MRFEDHLALADNLVSSTARFCIIIVALIIRFHHGGSFR